MPERAFPWHSVTCMKNGRGFINPARLCDADSYGLHFYGAGDRGSARRKLKIARIIRARRVYNLLFVLGLAWRWIRVYVNRQARLEIMFFVYARSWLENFQVFHIFKR